MFRYIFGTDVGRIIFHNVGDDLATCPTHGPQEGPDETEEGDKETADSMPSLKVERSQKYRADPRGTGKTSTRLVEVLRL